MRVAATVRGGTRWDRTSQVVLGTLLLMTMLLGVFGAARAAVHAVADREVVRTVDLAPERVDLGPSAGGYAFEASTGELTLSDAGPWQLVASLLGQLLGAAVVIAAAYLLWLVVRSLHEGDPFHRADARRLAAAALVVLLGGTAATLADALVGLAFSTDAVNALGEGSPIARGTQLSFLPLIVGLLLAAVAEFFRRGTALRDDLEGLV